MPVSQTDRFFILSIFSIFDLFVLDFPQDVAIYVVRCDEADGGVHIF